jgi:hypothetical protein
MSCPLLDLHSINSKAADHTIVARLLPTVSTETH